MKRLVESWIAAEKNYYGNTAAAAIRRLNEQVGMCVTHSRVAQWRRGKYVPSQVVLSAMLHRTLPWAHQQAGMALSKEQFSILEKLLWVVEEGDGETYTYML